MSKIVKITADALVLPNGRIATRGQEVVLTDAEFARIPDSDIPENLYDLASPPATPAPTVRSQPGSGGFQTQYGYFFVTTNESPYTSTGPGAGQANLLLEEGRGDLLSSGSVELVDGVMFVREAGLYQATAFLEIDYFVPDSTRTVDGYVYLAFQTVALRVGFSNTANSVSLGPKSQMVNTQVTATGYIPANTEMRYVVVWDGLSKATSPIPTLEINGDVQMFRLG